MNERKRNWGSADHARREAAELEQLMRHILSLFSAGCLVSSLDEAEAAEETKEAQEQGAESAADTPAADEPVVAEPAADPALIAN